MSPHPNNVTPGYESRDLAALPLAGRFYFRADDRYPGGNADMFTIKLTLLTLPGQPPQLRAQSHRNWDGEHWVYGDAPVKLDLSATLPALYAAATAALKANAADSSATLRDSRRDSEAYDTEWSSIEVELVALPAGSADLSAFDSGDLILRFVQEAVYSGDGNPPQGAALGLREAVKALCGLGRVEAYAENEAPLSGACNASGNSLGYVSSSVPRYL